MESPTAVPARILVVDDEPLVCESLRRMLEADGHHVQTVPDGFAALDLYGEGRFDLVLVDYDLPRMKGDELARALKALKPSLPIVLVTAFPETLASSGRSLIGVDSIVSKPFELKEVRTTIRKLLAGG